MAGKLTRRGLVFTEDALRTIAAADPERFEFSRGKLIATWFDERERCPDVPLPVGQRER